MLKSLAQLEHTAQQIVETMGENGLVKSVEDKVCKFICDHNTTFDVIKEALFQFQKTIGTLEDNSKAQQAAKVVATQPVPPIPVAQPETAPETKEAANEHQS